MDDFSSLSLPQIRLLCLERNLNSNGIKPVLIERLTSDETAVHYLPENVGYHGIFTVGMIKTKLNKMVRATIGLDNLTERSKYWAKVTIKPVSNSRNSSALDKSQEMKTDSSLPMIMFFEGNTWCIVYGYARNLSAITAGASIEAYIPVEKHSLEAVGG